MRKLRGKSGFTMAELLVVIAIIAVLGGVTALAFTTTQRNLAQRECETTAKEIFIAAQNHLALAKSQNYMGVTDYGTPGTLSEDKSGEKTIVYYIVVDHGDTEHGDILDQLLPFGAIDETVRAGGSYLIRYQPDPGVVLDVFYSAQNGSKYDCEIKKSDYENLMNARDADPSKQDNIGARRDFQGTGKVVGWFGGESVVEIGGNLVAPTIEVINAERLLVKVTDPNINNEEPSIKSLNPMLKLLISNESRTAVCAITITDVNGENVQPLAVPIDGQSRLYERNGETTTPGPITYTIALDDITKKGMHFADFVSGTLSDSASLNIEWKDAEKKILPGENIYIQAVAYSNKALTNVSYSGEWLTNSLFAGLREEPAKEGESNPTSVALIDNIRHLENLSTAISGFNNKNSEGNALFDVARQTTDLDWRTFDKAIKPEDTDTSLTVQVFDSSNSDSTVSKPGTFLPVNPGKALGEETGAPKYYLTYDGAGHSVSNIAADVSGDAGLFGTLDLGADNAVSNLKLLDFNIVSTGGNAGALAGKLNVTGSATTSNVTNVVTYNTIPETTPQVHVKTSTGNAGGLIGAMSGAIVEKSAAALVVESILGSAGGLIGSSTGGAVNASYSGGHTIDDADTGAVKYSDSAYNVTAGTAAGGLIGSAGNTAIAQCYSTCSAKGATAGGLVGTSSGSINDSYCTGLVGRASDTAKAGAFAGEYSGTAAKCLYFEIINESAPDATTGIIRYLPPVDGKETVSNITALDATAKTYDEFSFDSKITGYAWQDAVAYDEALKTYYNGKYNLKTVAQLGATVQAEVKAEDGSVTTPADFVAVHYGDWPVPEIFVLNTK